MGDVMRKYVFSILLVMFITSGLVTVASTYTDEQAEEWIQQMHPDYEHTFRVHEPWHPINQILWYPALNQEAVFNDTARPFSSFRYDLGSIENWWNASFTYFLFAHSVNASLVNVTNLYVEDLYSNKTYVNDLSVKYLNTSNISGNIVTVNQSEIYDRLFVEDIYLSEDVVINKTTWNLKGSVAGCDEGEVLQKVEANSFKCVSLIDFGAFLEGEVPHVPYWDGSEELSASLLYQIGEAIYSDSSFIPDINESYDLGSFLLWWNELYSSTVFTNTIYFGDIMLTNETIFEFIDTVYCPKGKVLQSKLNDLNCVPLLEDDALAPEQLVFVEFPSYRLSIQNGTDFWFLIRAIDFHGYSVSYSAYNVPDFLDVEINDDYVLLSGVPSNIGIEFSFSIRAHSPSDEREVAVRFITYDFDEVSSYSLFECGGFSPPLNVLKGGSRYIAEVPWKDWAFTDNAHPGLCEFSCLDGFTYNSVTNTCDSTDPADETEIYTLSISFTGSGTALLSGSIEGACSEDCLFSIRKDSLVQINPFANEGNRFIRFEEDCTGELCSLVMDNHKTVNLIFETVSYESPYLCFGELPISSYMNGSAYSDVETTWTYVETLPLNACEFTCIEGYEYNLLTNSCDRVLDPFDTLYTLDVSFEGDGFGSVVISAVSEYTCDDDCSIILREGETINLNAVPKEASYFEMYGGDCAGDACDLVMNDNKSVSITFGLDAHYACIGELPEGQYFNGSAYSDVETTWTYVETLPLNECEFTCVGGYEYNLSTNSCDRIGPFDELYSLTITFEGDGQGSVRIDDAESSTYYIIQYDAYPLSSSFICEGVSCTYYFEEGSSLELLSIMDEGNYFEWSGVSGCSSDSCVLYIDRDIEITARFIQLPLLVINPVPEGGFVFDTSNKIQCGDSFDLCQAYFSAEERVVLEVDASELHYISDWLGDASLCNAQSACEVIMDASKVLSADLERCEYSLEINELSDVPLRIHGLIRAQRLCFGLGSCIDSLDLVYDSFDTYPYDSSVNMFGVGNLRLDKLCIDISCISSFSIISSSELCPLNRFTLIETPTNFNVFGAVRAEGLCLGDTCISSWNIEVDYT